MRELSPKGDQILGVIRQITELGPRLPGSDAEDACRDLALHYLAGMNRGSISTEDFLFLNWIPVSQRLTRSSDEAEIHVAQLGFSPSGEVQGELAPCGGGTAVECRDAEGRVAICSSGWEESPRFLHRIEKYRNAVRAGAKAFVLIGEPRHAMPLGMIRKRRLGQIPAVAVGYEAARDLLDFGWAQGLFQLSVKSETGLAVSRNLVWRLGRPGPGIVLCAHCDSWSDGAWDNASGVAILLELSKWLAAQDLRRDVALCFTGAEEFGLFGSMDFSSRHAAEFAYAVNVDGAGLRDAELQARCSDRDLASIPPLRGVYSELPLTPWGDHYSFYKSGIRTILLTSGGTCPVQHTREDRPENLSPRELEKALNLLRRIVSYLDSVL